MKAEKKKPVKEEIAGIPGALDQVFAVQKPYSGCQLTSLVQPIDPLKGLEGSEMVPDQVHGVYPSKDLADKTANDLFLEYQKQQEALEKKKHMTMEKIKEVMDKIEEERAGHVNTIKENPENSQEARNKVAELATRMDELVNTMERIGKSKRNLDEKKGNENLLKKSSLTPQLYQKAKELKGFKESDWKFNPDEHVWEKDKPEKDKPIENTQKKEDIKEALKKALGKKQGIQEVEEKGSPSALVMKLKDIISKNLLTKLDQAERAAFDQYLDTVINKGPVGNLGSAMQNTANVLSKSTANIKTNPTASPKPPAGVKKP